MLNRTLSKLICISGLLSSPCFLFAMTSDGSQEAAGFKWYMGASIGVGFESVKADNQIVLDDAVPPSIGVYNINTSGHAVRDYGVFSGIILPTWTSQSWGSRLKILVGMGIYANSATTILGQGNINGENNFHFHYDLSGQRIVAETRIAYLVTQYIQPDLYLAAGYGQLSAKHFTNTPDDPHITNLPVYGDDLHGSFVGGVGVGILSQLTAHWGMSLDYQINNLGKAELSADANTASSVAFNAGRVIERVAKVSVYSYF